MPFMVKGLKGEMGRLKLIAVDPQSEPPGLKAAAYYRMSTDMQQLSIELQRRAVEDYCAKNGLRLVQTYADEGRSGLTLQGRPGLTSLLDDVQRGPEYQVLVVYDISRWGRFQDADESAYYDFMCRRAGVPVVYCAEPFAQDGSPMAAIMKTIKRVMAAEYSRELSTKVFIGQARTAELGFRVCGPAMHGLRRMMVDRDGVTRTLLGPGDHKHRTTDRVVLVLGPAKEVASVRRIYRLYIDERMSVTKIAAVFNSEGVFNHLGTPWHMKTVARILTNPNYAGHNVYNRTTKKLKTPHRAVAPDRWIWARDAFEAIIKQSDFDKVQRVILARSGDMTDEQMLRGLARVLKAYGRLSENIIAADDEIPGVTTFKKRFGSMANAYRRIGYLQEEELADLHLANYRRMAAARLRKVNVKIEVRRMKRLLRDPGTEGSLTGFARRKLAEVS